LHKTYQNVCLGTVPVASTSTAYTPISFSRGLQPRCASLSVQLKMKLFGT